jgi:hypothetical protein
MTSLFQDEFDTATRAEFQDVFGGTVALVRGANSVNVTAERKQVSHKTIDAEGKETVVREWSFRVDADDYTVADVEVTPQAGDQFKVTIDSTTHVFLVGRRDGRDVYEWADDHKTQWIVYARYIGTE